MNVKIPIISIVIMFSAVMWYIMPVMKPFPRPTGAYQVGVKTWHVIDQERFEQFSHNAQEKRSLMVHLLYPSKPSTGSPVSYLHDKMTYVKQVICRTFNIPKFLIDILSYNIKTHLFLNAQFVPDNQRYPIVLFSHGLLGFPSDMYISILSEIASHGYIVAAIDHPHFNELTLYSDGEIVSSRDLSMRFQQMSSEEQKTFQSKAIETYKSDMAFVINQLPQLNHDKNSYFYQRLDLDRIAVTGHSAGGTAAIEFCRSDSRCKAAIDLDGWYDHVIGYEHVRKLLLLVFGAKSLEVSEPTPEYLERKQLTREQYFKREQNIANHRKKLCSDSLCRIAVIDGAAHDDFGDGVLLKWPIRAWNSANSGATLRAIN